MSRKDRKPVKLTFFVAIGLSVCSLVHLKYDFGYLGHAAVDVCTRGSAANPLTLQANPMPTGCGFPVNNSFPIFRSEEDVMTNQPRNFHRKPGLDNADGPVLRGFLGGFVNLRNAYLLSKYQISFNCDMVYVPHGCKSESFSDSDVFSLLNSSLGDDGNVPFSLPGAQTLDSAIVIAQFWGQNYYHAMIEDLPRLAMVLDILESDHKAVILSYPHSLMYPTSRSSLLNKLLGLGNDRKWVSYDDNTVYFIRNLIIPTATRCGHGQPRALRLIRDRIIANTPVVLKADLERFWLKNPEVRAGEKATILVQKRTTRSLINHDDLVDALQSAFATCCTVIEFRGTEPLEEYIVMHHQAKIIVGPHGAGLSNILFAPPTASLVEIHSKAGNHGGKQINRCHQSTAKSLGIEYRMLIQESGESFGSNFMVDVQSVIDSVRELLANFTSSKV